MILNSKGELAKYKAAPVKQIRAFDGAKVDRLTTDWLTSQTSLDTDLRAGGKRLIDRSRWFEENTASGEGYLKSVERNVVGPNGIVLQMKIPASLNDPTPTHDRAAENIIERAWKKWGKKDYCTLGGMQSLIDVETVSSRSIERDGAILIRKHRGAGINRFGFALEVLDIDFLDDEKFIELRNGHRIRFGIEFNERGRPVAYHLHGEHPGDLYFRGVKPMTRVPARDMIHAYKFVRANQSRGVPSFASMMTNYRQLTGYTEAEIVNARASSLKQGFLEKQPGELSEWNGPENSNGGKYMDLEPGTIEELPTGYKFVSHTPTHPTTQYPDFVKQHMREQATSLGVSYISYANDPGDANFSSARVGLTDEREEWKMKQRVMIEHIMVPIFEDWLLSAIVSGAIPYSPNDYERLNHPVFQGRRWDWLDPRADSDAKKSMIDMGITSPARVIAESGADDEDIYDEIAEGLDRRMELGLVNQETQTAMQAARVSKEQQKTPIINTIGPAGGQSLIMLVSELAQGRLTPLAAETLLIEVYGLDEEAAKAVSSSAVSQKPIQENHAE